MWVLSFLLHLGLEQNTKEIIGLDAKFYERLIVPDLAALDVIGSIFVVQPKRKSL